MDPVNDVAVDTISLVFGLLTTSELKLCSHTCISPMFISSGESGIINDLHLVRAKYFFSIF